MGTFLSLLSCRYIITHGSCLWEVEKKSKTRLLRRPPSTAALWQTDFLRAVSRAIARFGVVRHPSSICLDSCDHACIIDASALRSPVGWRAVYSQSLLTLNVFFLYETLNKTLTTVYYTLLQNSYLFVLQFLLKKNKNIISLSIDLLDKNIRLMQRILLFST